MQRETKTVLETMNNLSDCCGKPSLGEVIDKSGVCSGCREHAIFCNVQELYGVYGVNRVYGGPEESGWFTDELTHLESRFVSEDEIADFKAEWKARDLEFETITIRHEVEMGDQSGREQGHYE